MENDLPSEMRSALDKRSPNPGRRAQGLFAVATAASGPQRHAVVELDRRGMVIRAEDTPHLRGFVDIVKGEDRIGRHLVVLSWARDGLAGYEFKRGGHAGSAPADYERPAHGALIEGPRAGG